MPHSRWLLIVHARRHAGQVVCLLVNSLREPENESLRQAFKSLILRTLAPELAPIAEIFDQPEEAMTARQRIKEWFENEKASNIATGREQGRAEGRSEGRAEGRSEGRAEGRSEGQRRLVEKQLRLKFGALSAEAQARLGAATSKQLDLWAERVLTAASLDDVWH